MLVCPIQHIETVDFLNDDALLSHMKTVGEQILGSFGRGTEFRFGFHKEPYISIFHLHMHCFLLPFSEVKYDRVQYGHMLHSV